MKAYVFKLAYLKAQEELAELRGRRAQLSRAYLVSYKTLELKLSTMVRELKAVADCDPDADVFFCPSTTDEEELVVGVRLENSEAEDRLVLY